MSESKLSANGGSRTLSIENIKEHKKDVRDFVIIVAVIISFLAYLEIVRPEWAYPKHNITLNITKINKLIEAPLLKHNDTNTCNDERVNDVETYDNCKEICDYEYVYDDFIREGYLPCLEACKTADIEDCKVYIDGK